ncbi:MAG TPA: sugar ABC transporter permease [Chloroflexia bacterium]|nr:sugar ABC transporter permease [Chloroflexia bacterium]
MATVSVKPSSDTGKLEQSALKNPGRFQKKLRASLKAYLFIAPAMIILFFFHFFPIVYAFFLSLYRQISVVKGFVPPSENFAGFYNYGRLFTDPDWWNAFFNTLGYAAGIVFLGLAAALGVALLLDKVKKGKSFYRVAFFLPYVTSLVAVGTVWYIIFSPYASNALVKPNPDKPGGLLNWIFAALGIPMQRWLIDDRGIFYIIFDNGGRVDWLSAVIRVALVVALFFGASRLYKARPDGLGTWISGLIFAAASIIGWSAFVELAHAVHWDGWIAGPSIAMVSITVVAVWHSLGFNVIIILAGLTNITRELYDAARIDGARGWSMLTRMTIPLLSPTLFFLLIVTTISAFQAFTLFFAILPGGATKSVKVLSLFYYDVAFQRGSNSDTSGFGYASTIVIFMLILIVTVNQLQQRVLSKRVNYD